MGRRKLELKKIEDKSSRQVTFSKRRKGLAKKASELSTLCDVDIALLIFSNSGNVYGSCSGNSLPKILSRYEEHSKGVKGAPMGDSGSTRELASGDLIHSVRRQLEGPEIGHLSSVQLVELENQINAALVQTSSQKTRLMMEPIFTLQERERMLLEENMLLQKEVKTREAFDISLKSGATSNGDSAPIRATLPLLRS